MPRALLPVSIDTALPAEAAPIVGGELVRCTSRLCTWPRGKILSGIIWRS